MNVQVINPSSSDALIGQGHAERQPAGGFAATLHAARGDDGALRQAAHDLVASAFIEPVFASLRENSFAEGAFAPSAVEKRFGPMLDAELSSRIASAANFPIVDAIVDRYRPTGTMMTAEGAIA